MTDDGSTVSAAEDGSAVSVTDEVSRGGGLLSISGIFWAQPQSSRRTIKIPGDIFKYFFIILLLSFFLLSYAFLIISGFLTFSDFSGFWVFSLQKCSYAFRISWHLTADSGGVFSFQGKNGPASAAADH
ncbi:MAG: hypothetical protein IIY77_09445 [Lachnospiraceae bacterium]|nr:hypothetical protein [Lachnospiraceae bacterium]